MKTSGRLLRPAEWDGMPAVTEVADPSGGRWLTEVGYDLAIRDAESPEAQRLTTDGNALRPWRVNAQVYSLIAEPAIWSPDGRRVVSLQADFTSVPRHPFVDWLAEPTTVEWRPQPVEESPCRGTGRVAIINVATTELTWLALPDHVLWTPMRWERDSSAVVFLGMEFAGALWLAHVDATTGNVTVLTHETVPGVFPYLPGVASAVRAEAPAGTSWWISDRDGDRRVYRVSADAAVAITPPGVQVDTVLGCDSPGLTVLARPERHAPYDVRPLRCHDDGSLREVAPANDTELPPDDGKPFVVLAADQATRLHGVLFRPPNFDASRRYPVVHCIYGGPQTIAHQPADTHLWGSSRAVASVLAQQGFVTTVVDARGTPGRGRAFQWPDVPDRVTAVIEDHRTVVNQLARERPWMDLDRCGVIGTSFGGYFAAQCGLRHPELFRAVVAHAGAYDPRTVLPGWFPGLLQTPYVDDPDAYDDASVIRHAKEFEPALMLIHGTADANVTLDQTLRLSAALTAAGRHHDLMLLPGQRHHLDLGAATFVLESAARFFDRELG